MSQQRSNPFDHDLIVLGGGCAGLSLAALVAQSADAPSTLVLEQRKEYVDDRSWCFFAPLRHRHDHLVSHRWSRWLVGRFNRAMVERQSRQFCYHYIRSSDFYRARCRQIETSAHCRLETETTVESVVQKGGGWEVQTNRGAVSARQIVDTRPPEPRDILKAPLIQYFSGVEIEVDCDQAFEPDCVELMTQLRIDDMGLLFSYILPFAHNRALVEVTRFASSDMSRERLDLDLQHLVEQRGWKEATVLRREFGRLPMGLPTDRGGPAAGAGCRGYVRAGVGGGAIRPSSGYAFMRIQNWAERCARELSRGGLAMSHPRDNVRQTAMDKLFLRVLREQPSLGPVLFMQLFERCHCDSVIRFMNDEASWIDCLRVIRSLPSRPFLASLLHSPRWLPAGSP